MKPTYKFIEFKIIAWFLSCALIGLVLGIATANYDERRYRPHQSQRSVRSGRRRDETVFYQVKKG